jgi:hypothetical protein
VLADDIAADPFLRAVFPGFDKIQKQVLAAQKFNLAADFAGAADGLTDNIPELMRIAPFCRVPYHLCWFEVAQQDRRHWVTAPTHFPTEQYAPARIGFLAEATNKELSAWRVYLMWSLKDIGKFGQFNMSALAVHWDMTKPMNKLEDPISFDWSPIDHTMHLQYTDAEKHMHDLIRSDWAGEIRFFYAILGLLNARNVAETERVEYSRLNKHRAKSKKFPLSTHTLLKIRTAHRRSLIGSGNAGPAEIRAHFVRGHFKARRTGLFFWGPHMRGKLEHGYVAKDYQITD